MPTDMEILDSAPAADTSTGTEAATDAALGTTESLTTPSDSTATDGQTTEAAPQVDAAAQTQVETVTEEDELNLNPEAAISDPLSIKALNDKITKSPELQAAIAKDPGLRNLLYATARLGAEAAQFKEVFQTPALAKTALDIANKHIEFESALSSGNALDALYALTAQRDAQGNVLFDQPNGAYNQMVVSQREEHLWPYLTEMALTSKDEDLRDAVAIVAMKLGDKINSPSPYAKAQGQAAPAKEHDPETTARLAKLDELERNQTNQTQQQQIQYQQAVVTGIGDSVGKAASSYLDNLLKAKPNVVMTDFIKTVVLEKSVQEIYNLAKEDVSYKNHINFLFRSSSQKDDALRTKLVAEATKYARERLPRIIAKHISEASKGVVASQQQRLTKQQQQQERPEVQGAAGVSLPSRQDPAERVKEFINKNKRKPTDRELLDL